MNENNPLYGDPNNFSAVQAAFDADPDSFGKNINGWGQMSLADKQAWFQKYVAGPNQGALNGVGGAPLKGPDITDELLQRARNSFALRLQQGNRQSNNYGAQLGGFTLDKPILGG